MRVIKFKAWDKVRTKMYDSVFYSYHRQTGIMNLSTEFGVLNFSERNAFELMQYTGLKDKNNKEIYEGDIIKIPNSEMYSRVFFEKGCFMIENYHKICIKFRGKIEVICSNPLSNEVIGNIHQNPELLEEKE